jgi:hypothetical protein
MTRVQLHCQKSVLVLKVVFATNLPHSSVAGMVEMATIRNRGPAADKGQWEAQIRRKGYPAQRKTFETKADAQAWIRAMTRKRCPLLRPLSDAAGHTAANPETKAKARFAQAIRIEAALSDYA